MLNDRSRKAEEITAIINFSALDLYIIIIYVDLIIL